MSGSKWSPLDLRLMHGKTGEIKTGTEWHEHYSAKGLFHVSRFCDYTTRYTGKYSNGNKLWACSQESYVIITPAQGEGEHLHVAQEEDPDHCTNCQIRDWVGEVLFYWKTEVFKEPYGTGDRVILDAKNRSNYNPPAQASAAIPSSRGSHATPVAPSLADSSLDTGTVESMQKEIGELKRERDTLLQRVQKLEMASQGVSNWSDEFATPAGSLVATTHPVTIASDAPSFTSAASDNADK